ncbi:DNA primase [hydrothermal vent metagenome]|uniref:DNA primase n=1 Tax=hydrothermal vent metagenome TaxID=652676 RepID=A0A3B0W524_9ZZZZ
MSDQSGTIPRSFIESLLSRTDVVQVINQRVPLKKAGTSYKACCPFHDEKTPSFNVSQTKQFYHCFGCGASGDALKFLMEYEGLSFVEAIEALALQVGLEVPREHLSPEKQKARQVQQQQQRDLFDVMHLAAKFYRHQLRDHAESGSARQYLKARGLSADIAKEFVIGFAPSGWDSLVSGLKADQKLKQQLVEVGLLVQKEDERLYDRFRHRIMFPIRDGRGRVIAFGGRILGDDQPKYLNSPETAIFHKSHTLYGLYEMRQSRAKCQYILVVEGYMDVVALAQFGVRNAVATLGTATTVEHLELLFREVGEIVFCFDGDTAGLKAAWKALQLVLPMMEGQRSVKFLFLPDGEDPDSMIRKDGFEGFNQRVKESLPLSAFLLQGLQRKLSFPVQSIEGRQQLVALAQPYVQAAHGLYQFLLAEGVAELVGLPTWRVEKQMNVRSGFAQPKKGSSFKNKATMVEGKLEVTLPLKIVRILFYRPQWAEFFDAKLVQDLFAIQQAHHACLAGVIDVLKSNQFEMGLAKQWMIDGGYSSELTLIERSTIPDEDGFLLSEFEALLLLLARTMDEGSLGRQGWSFDEMTRLQAFVKTLITQ